MPTIDENKYVWDGVYKWPDRGDEWSTPWGNPDMQWYGTILPRIHKFVPTDRILEIACGFGRWTQFLKNVCKRLVIVDLSEECISACRQRFSDCSHIEYYVNDGKSLDMINDSSIDFVFTFDSLVHADRSVLDSYITQLPRILSDKGAAFIHHSNLGEYQAVYSRVSGKANLEKLLKRLGIIEKQLHWRDFGVSARVVEDLANEAGLNCISQEIFPWGTKRTQNDCFSILVKDSSPFVRENRILRNASFMQEVSYILRLSHLYRMGED
jgi:ubiquinone/menaquinone biosynthesis C-methylase UbiE